MVLAIFASVVLVSLTIIVHYEVLRLTSLILPHLTMVRPRPRIMFVIYAAFVAHTIEVYFYAIGYWLLEQHYGFGGGAVMQVGSPHRLGFEDLVYFSTITYTSVGFGDVVPLGGLRLISGVEALNGLLMIGWSASFTFISMQELWPQHARRRSKAHHSS